MDGEAERPHQLDPCRGCQTDVVGVGHGEVDLGSAAAGDVGNDGLVVVDGESGDRQSRVERSFDADLDAGSDSSAQPHVEAVGATAFFEGGVGRHHRPRVVPGLGIARHGDLEGDLDPGSGLDRVLAHPDPDPRSHADLGVFGVAESESPVHRRVARVDRVDRRGQWSGTRYTVGGSRT